MLPMLNILLFILVCIYAVYLNGWFAPGVVRVKDSCKYAKIRRPHPVVLKPTQKK
jgi:hypothetical protein